MKTTVLALLICAATVGVIWHKEIREALNRKGGSPAPQSQMVSESPAVEVSPSPNKHWSRTSKRATATLSLGAAAKSRAFEDCRAKRKAEFNAYIKCGIETGYLDPATVPKTSPQNPPE